MAPLLMQAEGHQQKGARRGKGGWNIKSNNVAIIWIISVGRLGSESGLLVYWLQALESSPLWNMNDTLFTTRGSKYTG